MDENKKLKESPSNEELGFNDAELEDIMNEIEDLEKEFTEEVLNEPDSDEDLNISLATQTPEVTPEELSKGLGIEPSEEVVNLKLTEEEVKKTDLQEAIDSQFANNFESKEVEAVSEVKEEPVQHEAPALHTTSMNHSGPAESSMKFSVSGNMKVNLDFEVSGKHVSLWVNEKEGLVIEMEGGAKFSVPFSNESIKKAG